MKRNRKGCVVSPRRIAHCAPNPFSVLTEMSGQTAGGLSIVLSNTRCRIVGRALRSCDFKMPVSSIETKQSSLHLETTATTAGLPPLHNTLVEVDLLMPEGQHLQIFSTDSIKRSVRLFQILYDKYLSSNSGSTTS
jgi:hypothetical protein